MIVCVLDTNCGKRIGVNEEEMEGSFTLFKGSPEEAQTKAKEFSDILGIPIYRNGRDYPTPRLKFRVRMIVGQLEKNFPVPNAETGLILIRALIIVKPKAIYRLEVNYTEWNQWEDANCYRVDGYIIDDNFDMIPPWDQSRIRD